MNEHREATIIQDWAARAGGGGLTPPRPTIQRKPVILRLQMIYISIRAKDG